MKTRSLGRYDTQDSEVSEALHDMRHAMWLGLSPWTYLTIAVGVVTSSCIRMSGFSHGTSNYIDYKYYHDNIYIITTNNS